ncbi:unnamed protein product [Microthlaspi erraticum]|uniref:AP2/ERF domain-containing protein n=1 Tax=Microthlaspi erraticum TaxID=1685480 RepID=A0A6D2JHP2_9BRAS|nr:unnamed protein product [Microthlaspi erraticum]
MSAVFDSAVILSLFHISFPIQSSALCFGLTALLNALRFCSRRRLVLEVPSISMGLRPKRTCSGVECESDMKKLLRKVRIVVNDPDATDDSSSDEWFELHKPRKVKRIVREITLPYYQLSERSHDRCKTFRKKAQSHRESNNPVGVRLRQSGKWAAEITNPITKTKQWLGTYETVEEAAKAYADKRLEFDALVSSRNASVSSSVVSEEKMSLSKDVSASASGDVAKGEFDSLEFSRLQIPDLSFLAAEGEGESMVSGGNGNGVELDFDGFLMDDFSLLDNGDIDISGFENSVPSELPDFDFTDVELELGDFKFAFADQLAPPLNIACP